MTEPTVEEVAAKLGAALRDALNGLAAAQVLIQACSGRKSMMVDTFIERGNKILRAHLNGEGERG